jgi:hypothetical protein
VCVRPDDDFNAQVHWKGRGWRRQYDHVYVVVVLGYKGNARVCVLTHCFGLSGEFQKTK